jgi:hypothetical protein
MENIFEENPKWYQNIVLIDIIIIIGTFAFLAISAVIIYFGYPQVMMAINAEPMVVN